MMLEENYSIWTLPPEIREEILIHLPINIHLVSVGLASKTLLGCLILNSLSFANRQLRHHLAIQSKDIGEGNNLDSILHRLSIQHDSIHCAQDAELLSGHIYNQQLRMQELPLNYQALLYGECLNSSTCSLERNFGTLTRAKTLEFTQTLLTNQLLEFDPSCQNNQPIRNSCGKGYSEVVRLLLSDTRVIPDGQSLVLASKQGHSDTVQILLADHRVDPSFNNSSALTESCAFGYTEIVHLLLQHPSVDPSAQSNLAIRHASQKGYTEIVRLLLHHPSVDPSAKDNFSIGAASQKGYTEIVQLLLSHPAVDPTAFENFALKMASTFGHAETLKVLLKDARVDPIVDLVGDFGLMKAVEGGFLDVVRVFLDDGRVDFEGGSLKGRLEEREWVGWEGVVKMWLSERVEMRKFAFH
ncbi:UNVERIFIED_CONTAM: hypothetical protein HDU68_005759 [Siphonaria sp. JEL0065]|nr:hypothetical protein HDU68_005759 [Siphonaria sp. JEL0065]